jgi:DNA-binding ferritin-like protein
MNTIKEMHLSRQLSYPVSRFGAHRSLATAERIELIELLNQQLLTTLDLLEQVKRVQWKLRDVSFIAVQRLFHRIAWTTTECAESIASRITELGGFTERAVMSALYSDPQAHQGVGFGACIHNIHGYAQALSALAAQARDFMARAAVNGDHASHTLIKDSTDQVRELVFLIQAHLPQESIAPSPGKTSASFRKTA